MFQCMECGRKFRTAKAAERAAFGDRGCRGCGGSDIDLDPGPTTTPRQALWADGRVLQPMDDEPINPDGGYVPVGRD